MAGPLRFRRSPQSWSEKRVRRELLSDLDEAMGATMSGSWFKPPTGFEARRFTMENGDFALFCWNDNEAYWLGNTQTPSALWRTDKYSFDEVPYPVARWAQRELLADLKETDPWLASYDHVAWFFLPVFFSKDGRETTRKFFREHASGFPDADPDEAIQFYEDLLDTGLLDQYRYTMASKLGTSARLDKTRMDATMGEFNAARLLIDAGYELVPEIDVHTGHTLDFRAIKGETDVIVEVTRPRPPTKRVANTPTAAVRDTAATKTEGQLSEHHGAVLFVDCTSFRDDEWNAVAGEKPDVHHEPAVVFRARPDGTFRGYKKGGLPLDLDSAIEWA
ncbi:MULTISPECIES: DUF5784 family protein [unclassified Haladaptatus]|uniref:DUF5784 family protein n=1 Tax=unclassified Haladaptatus TaxID=2622732 RepID=UPI0023E844CC|nr:MULTISPECIES: DUF5784 family protein [unclassified Haladaptatus]